MLGIKFGSKRDKCIGGWSELHNYELHNLYSSPNIIRMMKLMWIGWARLVACIETKNSVQRVLVGKTEGRTPLRMHRRS
jgi:hypothetical protein